MSTQPCLLPARPRLVCAPLSLLLIALIGCGESARLATRAGTGPDPALPEPVQTVLPTVNIAPAVGWKAGEMPTPAPGFTVNAFATGFEHPRWLYVLPNGDVLVAETNGPAGKSGIKGLKGKVLASVMAKAGAGVPSPERIRLLR